jgi:hypothetical protein
MEAGPSSPVASIRRFRAESGFDKRKTYNLLVDWQFDKVLERAAHVDVDGGLETSGRR